MSKLEFCKQLNWRNPMFRKLAAFFFFMAVMSHPLKGVSQTITFSGKQVPLQQAFAEIKKQVNYSVIFNPELVNVNVNITVNAKKLPLDAFLQAILINHPLQYATVGTTIVVFPATTNSKDSTKNKLDEPQLKDVPGFVYEEKTGGPVVGATIMISGSGRGAQSDERGSFVLKKVKGDEVITVTSIGYEKATMVLPKTDPVIYVKMKVATSELDQAVVQAYGMTTKRFATGNISRVSAAEIERQPVMNPLLALQGKVAGLLITQTNGFANSPVKVEIRGRNSLAENYVADPLYVIDGVPQTVLDINGPSPYAQGVSQGVMQAGFSFTGGQSPLFRMNPKDIASIEVLKDAAATAIYGSRGANGVILITTKKAVPGKTTFTMGVEQGRIDVSRRWKMLNTAQYVAMRREALKNDGVPVTAANAPDLAVWDTTRYTDWQNVMLGAGGQTSVNASVNGGDNITAYRVSGNYSRQTNLLRQSGASQQGAINSAIDFNSRNQKFGATVSTNYSLTDVYALYGGGTALTLPPNAPPVYNSKGELNFEDWAAVGLSNQYPFTYFLRPNISKTNNFSTSLNIHYELMKGLVFTTTGGYNSTLANSDMFTPIASQDPVQNPVGFAYFGTTKNTGWNIEPQLSYRTVIGKGELAVYTGLALQNAHTNGITTAAVGYTDDNLIKSIGSAPFQQVMESDGRYKYTALSGRINYKLSNKYIFEISGRRDGSSRFAEGRQFGNFGAGSLSWILSEEKWMKSILPSWFSFMKLRSTYGITGSDQGIGDYQYLSQWARQLMNGGTAFLPYNGVQPFVPIHAVNQDYHWEANKKFEGNLSLGFLEDRINIDASYYQNRSGDQVTSMPMPKYTGFPTVVTNWGAVVQNSGLELALFASLIRNNDITWSVNFNISSNRNKLIAYPGIELSPYARLYQIGKSLNTRYYLHYIGVDPQTGLYSFEDYNKDGKINISYSAKPGTMDDDRYVPLDLTPKYYGGASTSFTYKSFGISLSFDYRKQLGQNPFAVNVPGKMANLPVEALADHWMKPGDIATYSKYSLYGSTSLQNSDGAYIDASFIRLTNLELRYNMSDKLLKKVGFNNVSLFMKAQNLFFISSYPGVDPEVQDYSNVPISRSVTGGLSFKL